MTDYTLPAQGRSEILDTVNRRAENADTPFKIRKAMQYIEANYLSRDIRLADIAKVVQMDRSSFSRLWKKTMDVSVMDFISHARIEHAKQMLTGTASYVSQIAYQVGYTPDYFSKVFKTRTGVTPKEYRQVRSDRR